MSDAEVVQEVEAEVEVVEGEAAPEEQQTPQVDPVALQKRLDGLESAVSAERQARQEAQRQADYYAGQVAALGQARPAPQTPPAPVVSDEEYWSNPVAATAKIVSHEISGAMTKAEQARIEREAQRLNLASARMRKKHEDYGAIEAEFLEAIKQNPALGQAAYHSPNPAEYVYEWGQERRASAANGDAAKRIAELEARLAELTGQPAKPPPRTQAGMRSAGTQTGGVGIGDPWAKDY